MNIVMFTLVAIFKRVSKIGIPLYYLTLSFDCAKDLFFTSIGISKTQTNRLYYPLLNKENGYSNVLYQLWILQQAKNKFRRLKKNDAYSL